MDGNAFALAAEKAGRGQHVIQPKQGEGDAYHCEDRGAPELLLGGGGVELVGFGVRRTMCSPPPGKGCVGDDQNGQQIYDRLLERRIGIELVEDWNHELMKNARAPA